MFQFPILAGPIRVDSKVESDDSECEFGFEGECGYEKSCLG